MKGLFIPEITAEMFRNGCLESIEALMAEGEVYDIEYDPKSAQQWIPVVLRPMTAEERSYYEEAAGEIFEDEDAVIFDSLMPGDGQEIWVTTKCGYVFQDVCENDFGMVGLEGNGDWADVIAWQPLYRPEPYKEENDMVIKRCETMKR